MRYLNIVALSAVDTSSQNGITIDCNQLLSASFQAIFGDAGATGTLKLQGSNDIANNYYEAPNNFVVTNWTTVATASVVSGAATFIPSTLLCYRWIRIIYTRASGGSSTITVNMDAIGQ